MASIRNLKKDINYVLGDLIEAVYLVELSREAQPDDATASLIEEALVAFDGLMARVNDKPEGAGKPHFQQIRKDLEQTARQLIEKINAL